MPKLKAETQAEYAKRTEYAAQKKYDQANTRFVGLKLNIKTDADILAAIENKPAQTEIKRLIRKALDTEQRPE